MKIIIATIKSWNIDNARKFAEKNKDLAEVLVITEKNELTYERVNDFSPDYIFFPHWSFFIPSQIYENFNCVVFHMTDLPYGRGGSPLQNLIVRGHKNTKISAIKVTKGLDEGPVYFKENLSLNGSADDIFRRASDIMFQTMLPRFINESLVPKEQEGEPVKFVRRKPEESEIKEDFSIDKIYDYIRMLDAEGYPNAFIKFGGYRLEFDKAEMKDGELSACVRFRKDENE